MTRLKSFGILSLLVIALLLSSCNRYSYYFREKDTKTRDCAKENSKSHKYKK